MDTVESVSAEQLPVGPGEAAARPDDNPSTDELEGRPAGKERGSYRNGLSSWEKGGLLSGRVSK